MAVDEAEAIEELKEILSLGGFHSEISDFTAPFLIEETKKKVVRSIVIEHYVSLEALISDIMEAYFIQETDKKIIFQQYIMDKFFLTHKIDFLKDVFCVEKDVLNFLRELSDLRNAMAHSADPRRRKRCEKDNHVIKYGPFDIYTKKGLWKLEEDFNHAFDVLLEISLDVAGVEIP